MNLNEAKEILKNNGYLVESTKTEIDCSNWHWIKSMSSYNNNYYYDTLSNDEFIQTVKVVLKIVMVNLY